jgi:uncharacterized membrane protein YfcA
VSGALLALPFGLAIGLLLGSVGAGGSLLAVPVLVYVLGEPVKTATTESLLVVGIAALVGAAGYVRSGRVQVETALAFGAAGAAGSIGGTALTVSSAAARSCSRSRFSCSSPRSRWCAAARRRAPDPPAPSPASRRSGSEPVS